MLIKIVAILFFIFIFPCEGNDLSQFAKDYAPYFRFDQKEGESELCFPHDAAEYYDERISGSTSRICNTDFNSISGGQIPTYWHAMTCGYHLHIAYWSFYGYNHDCDCCSGERDAWWEFLVVKVRDWDLSPRLHEVMFGQKKGWYTRIPGRYKVHEETHPVAYVGKTQHGFYHDDGGTGTCCYFEDFRNTGSANRYMESWLNLVELKQNGSDWMNDSNVWNGILPPTLRDDWNLCELVGCEGSSLQVCSTCGCAKSDIGSDPFYRV